MEGKSMSEKKNYLTSKAFKRKKRQSSLITATRRERRLTWSWNWQRWCLICFDDFLTNHRDLRCLCRWLKSASVCNIPPRHLCWAWKPLCKATKTFMINGPFVVGEQREKAGKCYLERCCGRQSWLGRPEALEPGVLTDCDLVWWGDPYLQVVMKEREQIKTKQSISKKKESCSHNKLAQMFPLLTSIITDIPFMKYETNGSAKEDRILKKENINPILPSNLIWAVLHDEEAFSSRHSFEQRFSCRLMKAGKWA